MSDDKGGRAYYRSTLDNGIVEIFIPEKMSRDEFNELEELLELIMRRFRRHVYENKTPKIEVSSAAEGAEEKIRSIMQDRGILTKEGGNNGR